MAYFYILTPHKGTPLYDRMRGENRILDEKHMRRTPGIVCEIKPSYCSPEEMEQNVQNMYEQFYSLPSMLRRLPPPVTKCNIASWIINVSQRRMRRSERLLQNFDWT